MANEKERIIEYLNPETIRQNLGPKQTIRWQFALLVALAVFPFGVLVIIPHGTCCFGHRPQWIIWFDGQELMVGPYDHALVLGVVTLYVIIGLLGACSWWLGRFFWRTKKGGERIRGTSQLND